MRSHCENCNEIFVFENSFCKYEENGSSRHVQPAYPKLQRLKSNLFWHLDFVFVLVFVFKDIPCFLSPLLILCLHVCFHLYPSLSPFITILNNFLHIYYVYIFNVFLSFFNGCCLMLFFRLVILFFFFFLFLSASISKSIAVYCCHHPGICQSRESHSGAFDWLFRDWNVPAWHKWLH